jgi:hypothetical protein
MPVAIIRGRALIEELANEEAPKAWGKTQGADVLFRNCVPDVAAFRVRARHATLGRRGSDERAEGGALWSTTSMPPT